MAQPSWQDLGKTKVFSAAILAKQQSGNAKGPRYF